MSVVKGMVINVKEKHREAHKEFDISPPHYKAFFYIAAVTFTVIFILFGVRTQGESYKGLFFKDTSDTFMDHYNSVIYNEIDPYVNKVIYPPLATITYKLCLETIPQDDYEILVTDPTAKAQPRRVRIGQSFNFQFILFTVITFFLFIASVECLKKGKPGEKAFFTMLLMLSGPFLSMLERGNNIIIPLTFSVFFVAFYDSENKILKEFALISLAIAVGFKIYPLAFGILLLRNKQYKELLRAGIYCFCTLVLPFFIFYDGLASIKMMLTNIVGLGNKRSSASNIEAQLDFKRIFYFLYGGTRKLTGITINSANIEQYAALFRYFCTAVCIVGTFFVKKRWQIVMLCAAIIYGYPGTCSTYLLVFMMIALILFIDEEKERSLKNLVYLGILTLTQVPFVISNSGAWDRYWPTKITSVLVVLLVALIFCELAVRFICWNEARRRENKRFFRASLEVMIMFFPDRLSEKLLCRLSGPSANTMPCEEVHE